MSASDLKKNILLELNTHALPDYRKLAAPEMLETAETVLSELLQKAEATFADILQTKDDDITFESIVERYLHQDEELNILFSFISSYNNTDSSKQTRQIVNNFQPKLVRYSNFVTLHPEYYKLLTKLRDSEQKLDPQQQKSLELLIRDMEMAGVHLKGAKRERLEEINLELSRLGEEFSNNVLDSRKEFSYRFKKADAIEDMPEEELDAAAEEALSRDTQGWVFTLSPPSLQSILQYCSDRKIRELFWRENMRVAAKGEFDNRAVILSMLRLRQEKAELLGFSNYAEFVLQARMAKSPKAVTDILERFSEAARKQAGSEVEDLKKLSGLADFTHWDVAYYSEKQKEILFQIDEKKLKQYFSLEQTLTGMFQLAQTLFGLEIRRTETKTYSDDAFVFEVFVEGKLTSYFILDPFARSQKRGGAWCDKLRGRHRTAEGKQIPVVINVSNFAKAAKGKPILLSHYSVETLFHEFGHALHLMLSRNDYSNLSGFETEWDFVELPSQLLENWTWEKEGLALFARHIKTGAAFPADLLINLKRSRKFMKGYFMLRQSEFGFLDFLLHTEAVPESVEALDKKCWDIANRYTIVPKPDNYYMFTSFGHIFGGGYAAGYYSYLWAAILEADVFSVFLEAGILNPEIGKKYREKILEPGASKPAEAIFHDFMGREAQPEALMRQLGLLDNE